MKDVEIEPEREGVWVRIHKLDSEWNTIFLYQQNNHGLIDLWFCAERSCIFYWQKPTTTWRSATLGLYANSMETSKFFLTFSWYFARALFGFFHFSSRSNCFCDFLMYQIGCAYPFGLARNGARVKLVSNKSKPESKTNKFYARLWKMDNRYACYCIVFTSTRFPYSHLSTIHNFHWSKEEYHRHLEILRMQFTTFLLKTS